MTEKTINKNEDQAINLEKLSDKYSIQKWLERTANGTLKDTNYGWKKGLPGPSKALLEDPLVKQIYLVDIAFFIAGERISFLATAGLIPLAPSEECQVYIASQVMDEARHYEVFCKKFDDYGYTSETRNAIVKSYVTPKMEVFHNLILEQIDKKDFISATIAQNIIMEGMAYPIYRYEYKYWSRFDPSLSGIIRGAFADEVHHVGYGEDVISSIYKNVSLESKNRIIKLLKQFEKLMTEVFEEIIYHYVGMYQECTNEHIDFVGDIEIFKGKQLGKVSEEMQVRILLDEIKKEHNLRLSRMGINI